jgi:hypothetical protein
LKDIGIQTQTGESTRGTTAIGHGLHLQVPGGFNHAMRAIVFSMAIGKTVIVEWTTTISGITTEIATSVVSLTEW